jgi:kinesin family member 6/9
LIHFLIFFVSGDSDGILQIKIPDDADPGISHNNTSGILEYEFDKVFDADASQGDIFDSIAREKVLDTFNGINCTIFAYGQTGSGKTYTIFGGDSFADRGLIPRSIAFFFKEIRSRQLSDSVCKCQVSFTEVYKETVYDLLDKQKKNLPIEQWTPVQVLEGEHGLTLRNLNVFEVNSEDDALSLFFLGNTNRITSATVMNEASSRSHAIFTMIIESKGLKDGKTMFTSGKMNFVDLAGSERIYKVDNQLSLVVKLHFAKEEKFDVHRRLL